MHWHSFFKGSSIATSTILIGKAIQLYFSQPPGSLSLCTNILGQALGLNTPLERIADELHSSKSNVAIIILGLMVVAGLHLYKSPPAATRRNTRL